MTRTAETLREFRLAGKRGLTRRDLQRIAGPRFTATIDRLEKRYGCVFISQRSRFSTRPFRWILRGEFPPAPPKPVRPELRHPADELLAGATEQLPLPVDEACS